MQREHVRMLKQRCESRVEIAFAAGLQDTPRPVAPARVTRAGPVGYLFETVHNAIAPVWQPGAYIRSCELSSVVERAHSNVARKTKGWLEHEIHHAAETREA